MASEVDICNLACSNLGQEANVQSISPPDASVSAEKCAQFYPIARDALLEAHAWSFNTRRAVLAQLSSNPSTTWSYAYSLPSDCVKPLAVYPQGVTDDAESEDYVVEAQSSGDPVLYTNCPVAELKYQIRVTATGRFSPLFVTSLSWLLAAYLAGALIKGKAAIGAADRAMRQFAVEFSRATASNANASQLSNSWRDRIPQHLLNR